MTELPGKTPDPAPPSNGEPVTFLGDFSQRLIANTFFNFLGRFWSFAATILLTPFILRYLSDSEFGVWVILSVLLSSTGLLDLGLGSSFVKFISAYYTYEDYPKINKVLFSGVIFYAFHGALLMAIGLAVRPLFLGAFGLSAVDGVSSTYLYVLVACVLGNFGMMFTSVFRGIQRMDRANAIDMALSIINVIGTVVVLTSGFGLRGLGLNAIANAFCYVVISWFSVRRTLPAISLGVHFDGALLREMFTYGTQILVSRVGGLACFQVDKLIAAKFLGVASVIFYEVSARMATLMRALPLLMMSAIIPAASELGARNEKEKIIRTYVMTSKYVALITIGLVAFMVLEADSILRLWLGDRFDIRSVMILQILAIGYGANVLGGAASQIGAGVGRPEFDMRSTILLTVLSPVLGMLLVLQFGAPGAAAGTALALIISAAYLLVSFHRNYVETPVEGMFRDIHIRPVVSGLVALFAAKGLHHLLPAMDSLRQVRYLIPAKLALDFLAFSLVYTLFLVVLKQVTAIDRRNLLGLMTFGFDFVRHPFRERVKIYR
jgi:O-antigen/teichoic acid export membrane protein